MLLASIRTTVRMSSIGLHFVTTRTLQIFLHILQVSCFSTLLSFSKGILIRPPKKRASPVAAFAPPWIKLTSDKKNLRFCIPMKCVYCSFPTFRLFTAFIRITQARIFRMQGKCNATGLFPCSKLYESPVHNIKHCVVVLILAGENSGGRNVASYHMIACGPSKKPLAKLNAEQ